MHEEGPLINRLDSMLGDRSKETIYPCIRDLLEHGLDLSRFLAGEMTPNLQDITQYLAAWSRHAGLSEDESSCWLIDYCITTGSALSKRTPAAIRHSTKSNLRYIYRSAVTFLCQGSSNGFRARCGDCTVHADLPADAGARTGGPPPSRSVAYHPAPLPEPSLKKAAFKEQFQAGLRLIQDEVQQGTPIQSILDTLHERGCKTRTGRQWQPANLRLELKKLMDAPVASAPLHD